MIGCRPTRNITTPSATNWHTNALKPDGRHSPHHHTTHDFYTGTTLTRPKNATRPNDDHLAWFNLKNYDGLKDKTDGPPNFELWYTVIRDRIEVQRWIDAGKIDYITPLFEKLKSSPLKALGFDHNYRLILHPTNTRTVNLITSNRIQALNDSMPDTEAGDSTANVIVDQQLLDDEIVTFSDFIHLTINLRAPDEQIKADFDKLLQAWRNHTTDVKHHDYKNMFASWASAKLVPFVDLELFSALTGLKIHRNRKFGELLGIGEAEIESQRKRLQGLKHRHFTDEYAKLIQTLDKEQKESQGKKPQ